ncbi:MAG: hypothetical protein M1142_03945 [Patescibacteria group bacterium]|nr:hypothetical protein [Patescibacteria group bacterium]
MSKEKLVSIKIPQVLAQDLEEIATRHGSSRDEICQKILRFGAAIERMQQSGGAIGTIYVRFEEGINRVDLFPQKDQVEEEKIPSNITQFPTKD